MIAKTFILAQRRANSLFDSLKRNFGTRIEKGGPLLDRQIPRIAGLFGGGCARRRRRLFSPVRRRAPGQHHAGRNQRGARSSTSSHNLYDAPPGRTVPPSPRVPEPEALRRAMRGKIQSVRGHIQ